MKLTADRCAWLLVAIAAAACSSPEEKPAAEEAEDESIPDVPVPPADGPPLFALRHGVIVRDRPSLSGKPLGTLTGGAHVARAEEPYSDKGCPGGWYPIRPRGFVCVGEEATLDGDSEAVKAFGPGPNVEKPMPYRYARVATSAAVTYGTVPTREEQVKAEPKLGSDKPPPVTRLGMGSNDVPLDDSARPTGPPVLMPEAEGVTDGYRTNESWFGLENAPALQVGATLLTGHPSATQTRVLKRRSGLALVGVFPTGEGEQLRRFGLMPDGRVIAVDRLEPELGTEWHGVHVEPDGLPLAFALRHGVRPWKLERGKADKLDEEIDPLAAIPLSGRFRTVNSVKFFYAKDDYWVRHKDVIIVNPRDKYPDWATADQKWIDISLANQTLVAYQGRKALLATLISTGEERLGDPQTGPSTVQGVFRLRSKHITRSIDDREVGQAYSVDNAPWVLEFAEGFAITGCFWKDSWGEARTYHDVIASPIDAHWLWHWSQPEVPEGWHSVVVDEAADENTIVYVHK